MKSKWLLLFGILILFFAGSSIIAPVLDQTCNDTDDGLKKYTLGECTDDSGSYSDGCSAYNTKVKEYYCDEGRCDYTYMECPNGECCENGECDGVSGSCSESDNRKDEFTAGTCTDSCHPSFADECSVHETKVKEYYCNANDHCDYTYISCPLNQLCEDGECADSEEECEDYTDCPYPKVQYCTSNNECLCRDEKCESACLDANKEGGICGETETYSYNLIDNCYCKGEDTGNGEDGGGNGEDNGDEDGTENGEEIGCNSINCGACETKKKCTDVGCNWNETTQKCESACFIATATYGSKLHYKLDTLREFRDEILLSNQAGIILVEAYYHYSPPIARFLGNNLIFRIIVKKYVVEPFYYLSKFILFLF